MSAPVKTPQLQRAFRIRRGLTLALQLMLCGVSIAVPLKPSLAAGCSFAPQREGRVAAVLDARGFRLEDGREVRLAASSRFYLRRRRRIAPRRWPRSLKVAR
jgi:hypothetical protein